MANVYNSQLDAYSLYHKTQEEHKLTFDGPALPALGHALAGSTGTAISNLAIYPLDLVITRLQVQRQLRKSSSTPDANEYEGVLDAFSQIYNKEGGLSAFYTGVVQDTGKSIADSFLFFLFYNYMRTNRLQKHGGNATSLPVLDELSVGALAGACSKFFTTPISNIVTRKQTASMISARSGSHAAEPSVADIASQIRSEKGIQGFWSGYSASLVLTLNPSITFFLYEFFKRCLPQSKRDDPGARLTFLMAAVSKAIASTITYPFSLAKTRAQCSSAPPVDSQTKSEAKSAANSSDRERAKQHAKNAAKRSTVFSTILQIYRTEGPNALYEGVLGEVLKGFFSHGLTMIVKESIHKLIIQTYYLVLKALNKFPSPAELKHQAGEALQDGAEKVGEAVQNGREMAGVTGERIGVMGTNATEVAKNVGGNVSGRVGDALQSGKEYAGVAAERAGVAGSNATEGAKNVDDHASKEAGHLLGNAQEMLGDKIKKVGEGIKPDEK